MSKKQGRLKTRMENKDRQNNVNNEEVKTRTAKQGRKTRTVKTRTGKKKVGKEGRENTFSSICESKYIAKVAV